MVSKKSPEEDIVKVNLWEGFQVPVKRGMAMCFMEKREHIQKQGVERNATQLGYCRSWNITRGGD